MRGDGWQCGRCLGVSQHPARSFAMRLACIGPAEVLDAIASMGRTEDVSWSPDGRRVALAAITLDRVLVVGMDCQFENGQKVLYLTDAVEVASTSLQRPMACAGSATASSRSPAGRAMYRCSTFPRRIDRDDA